MRYGNVIAVSISTAWIGSVEGCNFSAVHSFSFDPFLSTYFNKSDLSENFESPVRGAVIISLGKKSGSSLKKWAHTILSPYRPT